MADKNKNIEESTLKEIKYLVDNIPYAIWIKGDDGVYRYVNKYYAQLTNATPDDIIGKNDYKVKNRDEELSELFLAEDREILQNRKPIFNRRIPVNMEFKNLFEVSTMLIEDNKDDKSVCIGGIGRNITINENLYKEIEKSTLTLLNDRKEDQTSELPYILKDTLKANEITIFIFDEECKKMNIFLKTYGDDVITKDYSFYLDNEGIKEYMEAHSKNKYLETQYVGEKVKAYVRTYPIEFENEFIGILNAYYDNKETCSNNIQEDVVRTTCERLGAIIKNRILTNKYKKELQKRKESEKKLQIFLENSIDFYFIVDEDKLSFENGSSKVKFEKFLGYSSEELEEKINNKTLRHPEDEKIIHKIYKTARVDTSIQGFIIRYQCSNGEYKSIKWNMRYNADDDKFYITGKDITTRLKLEKEKRELEKTIEVESLKNDFFANMSHEFKTPLNIILTTVQVLSDKLKNSKERYDLEMITKYLKGIKQNSYRLLKIVNNIMDITKIDSGCYNLELGNYNIVSIIEDIVLSVAGYVSQNKRNIIFDTMEEEIMLSCDPVKIERIMLNLLSNSLKYTDEGGNIEVFIDIDKEKEEVIISVENDGEPISDEDKERIFERFTQSENLLTRKTEGTGIGLFLVKLLVELHGGRIFVDTSGKKGTKFVFILPIRLIEEKEENYSYTKQIVSKVEKCNIEFSDIYSI